MKMPMKAGIIIDHLQSSASPTQPQKHIAANPSRLAPTNGRPTPGPRANLLQVRREQRPRSSSR
jgi:hypothetical protein